MVTFRNNNNTNRRNSFRRNTRGFKSNNDNSKFGSNFSNSDNFKRKAPGRNNYNDLAREALSNGDKILSENYLQHADHFTRVLSEKESIRREKFQQNRSEKVSDIYEENVENLDQNSEKEFVDTTSEETNIKKDDESQVEVN